MGEHSGVYLVKTDTWYLERVVWLIAGTIVSIGSLLTYLHNPNWAFCIFFVGLFSLTVSISGFCIVGNILYLIGVKPLLQRSAPAKEAKRSALYFMQTDKWFLERDIYLFVGINLSISSMLARFYSLYWLYFTGFVGLATVLFAFTGFCIMANLLYRLGAEPRLCGRL